MSWKQYRLGDILQKKRNVVRIEPDNEYKLVTIRLHHKGITLRKTAKGSEIKSTMSVIKAGDFLLSGIDARNGAFGIVPSELDGAIITNDFWCLKPNEDVIDREYLLLLTETPEFDHICRISSEGVTQRIRLQKDKFFAYSVVIPPITEQKEIVRRIQDIKNQNNKLSVELNKQLDLVEKLRQAFLREAMQGKLVPQDPNDEPASELLKRIKAEKARLIKEKKLKPGKELPPIKPEEIPYPIPANWVWCRLATISKKIQYGLNTSAKHTTEGVRLIRITDIQNNKVNWSAVPGCLVSHNEAIEYSLSENDILIARTGGTIGKSYIIKNIPFESVYASYLIRIVLIDQIVPEYVKLFLESPEYWTQLYEIAWGAGQLNVNGTSLSKLLLPIPPESEQLRMVNKLIIHMSICDELQNGFKSSLLLIDDLIKTMLSEK